MSSVTIWSIPSGSEIANLSERSSVNIQLPIVNNLTGVEIEIISGSIPAGTRIEGTAIVGTAYEVAEITKYTAVLRAHWNGFFDDRTVSVVVSGNDSPKWTTVGKREYLYVKNTASQTVFEIVGEPSTLEVTTVGSRPKYHVIPVRYVRGSVPDVNNIVEISYGQINTAFTYNLNNTKSIENILPGDTWFDNQNKYQITKLFLSSQDVDQKKTTELLNEFRFTNNTGLLPVGFNDALFVLDNQIIDFQLQATDTDLSAGDQLEFFIARGDGELPPGIQLTKDGRLVGTTEPLLSLDQRYLTGGYDSHPYGDFPMDYSVLPGNGFSTYYYDSQVYDFFETTQSLKKLNRYYSFYVTVTDGDYFVRRQFKIYLVGDDFLRSDNTVMNVGTGIFTADNTHVRTPVWITPRDLGFKRASNYVTIPLQIIDNDQLVGAVSYTLENVNDDGSESQLPPGMDLDGDTGYIAGRVPYQPAITKNYKFTVTATRVEGDFESLRLYANYYEDTITGNYSFKIYKLSPESLADGLDDLQSLVGREILLGRTLHTVTDVDDRDPEYDVIHVDRPLIPEINLIVSRNTELGVNTFFVDRLAENDRNQYIGRALIFSNSEKYTITNILPFVEYDIQTKSSSNSDVFAENAPLIYDNSQITVYDQGDIYQNPSDGFIYQCVNEHSADIFDVSKWNKIADDSSQLTDQQLISATELALMKTFSVTAYVDIVNQDRWRIRLVSNQITRSLSNIKNFFENTVTDNDYNYTFRDNQDQIILDSNLTRTFVQGKNLGIALFKDDFFFENYIIAGTDETTMPSSSKTFELNIIGEIDSTITWITDGDLGTLQANIPSLITLEAQTTVSNTGMIYTLKSGKLPNGMYLSYNGDIIGRANQYPDSQTLGLTTFDNRTMTWDGNNPGDTTFDRRYTFTVEARDRFGLSAVEKQFTLLIQDPDELEYTDVYIKPFLNLTQRQTFNNFVTDRNIFPHEFVYRPNDPRYGLRRDLKTMIIAGIQAEEAQSFVAAAAKNHKRKRYQLGEFKKAVAKFPGSDDVVYEVIYVDVIDPAMPKQGESRNKFDIKTKNRLTVDSLNYDAATMESSPYTLRPINDNTIKVDSDAVIISTGKDDLKYISNFKNMRDRLKEIGTEDRDYVELWMRTPQDGLVEQEFISAMPVCYCKPGTADQILENIKFSEFDIKTIDYEIDRYIVEKTKNNKDHQYIVFANYQFNV